MGDREVHGRQEQRPGEGGEHEQPERAPGGIGLDGRGMGPDRRRFGPDRVAPAWIPAGRPPSEVCVAPAQRPRRRATTTAPTATAARRLRHAAAGTGWNAVRANEVATYADPNPIAASAANNSPR